MLWSKKKQEKYDKKKHNSENIGKKIIFRRDHFSYREMSFLMLDIVVLGRQILENFVN